MASPTRALWLRLRNMPVLRMLQLEEAIFRTDTRSWFITNTWDAPPTSAGPERDAAHAAAQSVVLGISGKPAEMLNTEEVLKAGVPVIKRFSGGGTIISDAGGLLKHVALTSHANTAAARAARGVAHPAAPPAAPDTLFATFICAADDEPQASPPPRHFLDAS